MRKVFWFINQYSSTPEYGLGGRHYYLAQELARQGHLVYVIASNSHHLLRVPKHLSENFLVERIEDNFNFIWVKLPVYDGAHSRRRVLNWFEFSWKLGKLASLKIEKPDVIIYSSPSLIGYIGAKKLANKFGVPFVFEVRDIWPLTLTELGGISKKHPFINFMQWIEDRAYQKSDIVFSNLFNAVEHMVSRGMDKNKFHWIPNGISIPEVENKEPLSDKVISQIPADKFIIGYTGTIGTANAIDNLIEAANLLKDYPKIHFLLVGGGKDKKHLEDLVKNNGLINVTFIESIPKKQVQSIIELFDICFIGSQNISLYRFGVAPNKVPEYLYSGKPIVHAYSGAGCLIEKSMSGFSIPSGDSQLLSEAILKLYHLSDETRLEMGRNGHEFAVNYLSYTQISKKLFKAIFGD